jgi:peptidyl-tRNA hydrolase, PTH1 family
MKIIVGLGNPGVEYVHTRHNAGILLVDRLSEKMKSDYGWRRHKEAFVFETTEVILAKTAGRFMNESGIWIRELIKNTNNPELTLVHDDLDIKLGEYKIQNGIGPKVHNGVESVENALGNKEFTRVRIGVDNRDPENRIPGEQYVLQKFPPEEKKMLEEVLEQICDRLQQN